MVDDPTANRDSAEMPTSPLITTVDRHRQRHHRPTVVDDAPPDWEWEDWAARFWASEPHALADEPLHSDRR
jgi:hypothetical protein